MTTDDPADDFPIDLGMLKATLRTLLHGIGQGEASSLVALAEVSVRLTEFDNWNGGTYTWALDLEVDIDTFAAFQGSPKGTFEAAIVEQTRLLLERFENHECRAAHIVPQLLPADASTPHTPIDRTRGFARREHFLEARELLLEGARPLGTGGYGEVWRARHRHTDLSLAIKFFKPSPLAADTETKRRKARERLIREAKLLGAVRHANVLKLLDQDFATAATTIAGQAEPLLPKLALLLSASRAHFWSEEKRCQAADLEDALGTRPW